MKNTKIIETFLNGEMPEPERTGFLKEMELNKSLTFDVALHKEVNEAIADNQLHEFRKTIQSLIKESRINQKKTINLSYRLIKYPLVASICVLISLSLWQVFSVTNPEKIYSNFYQPYETDFSTRSSIELKDKSALAIQLYEKGDYEASFEIFTNYLAKNFGNQTARFYYAMTSLELGKTDIAIIEFKQVESDSLSDYSLHSKWYLAMAYLKMKNKEEAIKYLKPIAEEDNFYSDRAKTILKKLKS